MFIAVVPMAMAACSASSDSTATYLDTGIATTTTIFSVPADIPDITPQQIRELMARYADISMTELRLEITDYETFGDWAAAKVHGQMEATGLVFRKEDNAWFFWGGIAEGGEAQWELNQMGAPEEILSFFGY